MKDKILQYFDKRMAEIRSDHAEIIAGSNAAYQLALFELHDEVHLMMVREKLLEVLNERATQLQPRGVETVLKIS